MSGRVVWCEPCVVRCVLQSGRAVYPHRPDLAKVKVWVCPLCAARVGCHPGTEKPLGSPASADLRRARMMLHNLRLDPLWKMAPREHYGRPGRRRALVYKFLAYKLDIPRDETHTGMFSLERCRDAWRALHGVSFADVEAFHQAERASVPVPTPEPRREEGNR